MEASVLRVARGLGVDHDLEQLERAHRVAMESRDHAFGGDDHHPSYLHPGRTVLVLLRDAGVLDADVLAAAAVTDTRTPTACTPDSILIDVLSRRACVFRKQVPPHTAPDLAERLVLAPEEVRLIALADHLDTLRHLHMLSPTDDWGDLYRDVQRLWGPLAERTDVELARRYATWARSFARRLDG